MVLKLQLWHGARLPTLGLVLVLTLFHTTFASNAKADAAASLKDAQSLYQSGQYFKAARYAFDAAEENPTAKADAYSWVTLSLVRAGLPNAASYFFIKTLQSGNKPAIQRVLTETQTLLVQVGADLLRKYLIRHTRYEDYNTANRSAYLYTLGKEALLSGKEKDAVGYLSGVDSRNSLWPFALQLRASAHAIQGSSGDALKDFKTCFEKATQIIEGAGGDNQRQVQLRREADDLRTRCLAGHARTLYQDNKFEDADQLYDRIPKASIVWPDILFEQAWNSFSKEEYNRSLGKLVTYKSPALAFVFNPEVDVLRAQSYLALCLYEDANTVINEFNQKYTKVGEEIKKFVEKNSDNLYAFYDFGRQVLKAPLYSTKDSYRMTNRFVRGPYFQNLVASESAISREAAAIQQFNAAQTDLRTGPGKGFPGFLDEVLKWRLKSVKLLGGAFVKNSLIDYHSALIGDFEKVAFIKLEMLKRAKERLIYKRASSAERDRGNVVPTRKDYQYRWSFNGEFWNDELGDYVFGLESECKNES